MRETAPAKADSAGDLFYATGRNEIARLPLGSQGQFLVPGASAPQWASVPTPITTQGDLVVGNASGDPVRFGISSGTRQLTSINGTLAWRSAFETPWWEYAEWWSEGGSDDATWASGSTIMISGTRIYRDLTIEGNVTILGSNAVVRARNVNISSSTTVQMLSSIDDFSDSIPLPNDGGNGSSGGHHPSNNALAGLPGTKYCGGGGGSGGRDCLAIWSKREGTMEGTQRAGLLLLPEQYFLRHFNRFKRKAQGTGSTVLAIFLGAVAA